MPHRADDPRDGRFPNRRGYDPSLRIGDAERDEVAAALGNHFSAGRLDETELHERLDRASAARTGADLAGILSDLPPLAAPVPEAPSHPWRTAAWVALALVLLAFAMPWRTGPWGWWFPHPPVFLVGVVLVAAWVRARRRRWRTATGH